jgi:hypothetical protein
LRYMKLYCYFVNDFSYELYGIKEFKPCALHL